MQHFTASRQNWMPTQGDLPTALFRLRRRSTRGKIRSISNMKNHESEADNFRSCERLRRSGRDFAIRYLFLLPSDFSGKFNT